MNTILKKILLSLFIIVSLVIIIYGLLFIISQMVNMKYYFDHSLPTPIYSSENTIPICKKEFFQELILFAKIIVGYAICGLVLSIFVIGENNFSKVYVFVVRPPFAHSNFLGLVSLFR